MNEESDNISIGGLMVAATIWPIFSAPILIAKSAFSAFVLFKLWGWYLPDVFGSPKFPAAFGIALIGTFLTYQAHTQSHARKDMMQRFGDTALMPLCALFTGWIGTFLF